MNNQPFLETALLLLVSAAAITDLASRRIPNRLLLAGWLILVPLQLLGPSVGSALLGTLAAAAVGLLLFLPLYMLRGMAAGDVKLMATVGAFVGPASAFQIALWSWCAGGVMALLMIVCKGQVRNAAASLASLGRAFLMRTPHGPGAAAPAQTSVGGMPYGVAVASATIWFLVSRYS